MGLELCEQDLYTLIKRRREAWCYRTPAYSLQPLPASTCAEHARTNLNLPCARLFSLPHDVLTSHRGALAHAEARFYVAELVLAIEAVHSIGFVHCDVKPENALLSRAGHVKLCDFGCATKLPDGASPAPQPARCLLHRSVGSRCL